ncbi:MAG: hypothetical protein M3Y12_05695 [Bacteroidota bacterium]|nr:hypothetical protein [Bacteroidota bacterium]
MWLFTQLPATRRPAALQQFWARAWLLGLLLVLLATPARAALPEDTLAVHPNRAEVYLDANYYSLLEDPTGHLTLADVQGPAWASRFRRVRGSGQPANIRHPRSTYWLRLMVRHAPIETDAWYLELYDSHIGQAVFYRPRPGSATAYDSVATEATRSFATRPDDPAGKYDHQPYRGAEGRGPGLG